MHLLYMYNCKLINSMKRKLVLIVLAYKMCVENTDVDFMKSFLIITCPSIINRPVEQSDAYLNNLKQYLYYVQ